LGQELTELFPGGGGRAIFLTGVPLWKLQVDDDESAGYRSL